ncbi:hypothetical protein DD594_26960, partial [Enterobacter cloacae complex sp. 4DZ1-17B1]|uniref:hypothetical protein n=1 Tax=Enterobacter cloacae complex sp. 4DZ1-17B1 TaxID=2511991 RepID=UPI0010257DF5
SDCQKVEETAFKEADAALRANDGTGKYLGKAVFRKIIDSPLPLGIGLTESPAADVKGVTASNIEPKLDINDIKEKMATFIKEAVAQEFKTQTQISLSAKNTVNKNEDKSKNMKINKPEDLTDETLKEVKASEVTDFLKTEIKKA